jgi:hypothetical protein
MAVLLGIEIAMKMTLVLRMLLARRRRYRAHVLGPGVISFKTATRKGAFGARFMPSAK